MRMPGADDGKDWDDFVEADEWDDSSDGEDSQS